MKRALRVVGCIWLGTGMAALLLAVLAPAEWASVGSVWDKLPASVRTAVVLITSLGAVCGAVGAAAGEQIGGPFGRGFGQRLGENIGSGKIPGLVLGGGEVLAGEKALGEILGETLKDEVKGAVEDSLIEQILGPEEARDEMARQWTNDQLPGNLR